MSGNAPVDPAEIPVFTGDLAVLDAQVKLISSGGAAVSTKASDVHTSFGGLQAFYQAPEADQLFATTKPVSDLGLKLSSDMCTIAGALGTYSRDVAPVIKKLENLRAEAEAFRTKVSKEEKWREDGDLIDENLDRRNKVAEVWEEFHEVERAAHAKIVALVGGKPLRVNDGSNAPDMYGYDAEALKQAKSLPWGDAVEESIPAWQVWEHAWEFGKGIVVDGVWGTLKGLGGLVGLQGWDVFKQSWTGLAKLGTGLAIMSIPGAGPLFLAAPDDKLPSWLRDSRTAMKETGKALLAWDQWGSNPSRAAGAVTFNVVTTIFTGGAGGAAAGAGKAGAAAKALSFAGKAGHAIDPMTYIFKGAGAGISKIGDVMAGLKGMGKIEVPNINLDGAIALPEGAVHLPDGAIHLPSGSAVPDGAIKLPDGNIKLPEGTTTLPPGTVKLPVDGPSQFMDPKGNIYDADGAITQHAKDAPTGKPDADSGVPRTEAPKTDTPSTARVPERELVGVGARGGDNGINLGSNISDPVHALDNGPRGADHTPGGHAPDNMPRGDLNNPGGPRPDSPSPTGATHPDTPGGGGTHADGPGSGGATHGDGPGGGSRDDGPGAGSSHHEPASTGGHHPPTPGTGSLGDLGNTADDAATPTPGTGATDNAATSAPAGPRQPVQRPSFMLHGSDPYGPPGRLTENQIQEIQVYRANEEPGYFESFYKENGNRKRLKFKDESGFTPPQLTRESTNHPWIRAKDAPDPPTPHYLDPHLIHRDADTVTDSARLERLKGATKDRYFTIEWDLLAERLKKEAEATHKITGTDETLGLWAESRGAYRESHTQMVKETERYGEFVAEHHYIAENHAGSVKQTLHGPKNGNDQFDQVWLTPDGRYVVIEAKSSIKTQLGGRNLPSGRRVSQGSQEYFFDIIREMKDRGKTIKSEDDLAEALKTALKKGKLDYVVVKGDSNAPAYNGHHYQRFDLSKRSLP
ncbi:hypothetical protein [Streptomyces erythrochromogenes]|uniref:hypothetical protein n=1 Tax=Streptomyces erythrochromogenes TaxID=285574 RepID=UPI0038691BD5|nr:hypothetical protein OG489_21780 [Streptomyces erythrochromogenes]